MASPATAQSEIVPGWNLAPSPHNERLDRELLSRAYQFSERAHRGQTRNSGEPFVTHCVEVAKILADLQLDSLTVACGLIHDVVEDTDLSIADVEAEFGREVASIVDGLTKIAKLPSGGSQQERQGQKHPQPPPPLPQDAPGIIIQLPDPPPQ